MQCPNCDRAELGEFWNDSDVPRPDEGPKSSSTELTEFGWMLYKCAICGYEEHDIAMEPQ